MEWMQAVMIAGSTVGACWMMHRESKQLSKDLAAETKDFHGRLCTLEERYLQMMQKMMEK